MPAATLNRDRVAAQQLPTDPRERLQNTQDAIALAQQYNQDLANGTTTCAPTSLETFMLSIALEEDIDLSEFSLVTNNNTTAQPPSTQGAQATGQSTNPLNRTLLLSGNRS
ncbi:hypothetical protein BG004_000594 [Podila humilis]|nr:hypothetical protein BG004_000594 [Podila humilis]